MINKRFFLVMFIVFFIINGCYLFKYAIYAEVTVDDNHIEVKEGEYATTYLKLTNGKTSNRTMEGNLYIFTYLGYPGKIRFHEKLESDDGNGNKTYKVTIKGEKARRYTWILDT